MLLTLETWPAPTLLIAAACLWLALVFSGFMTTLASRAGVRGAATSQCPGCATTIPAPARLPIVGWLVARGRCAECGLRVPLAYPGIEIVSFAAILLTAAAGVDLWLNPDTPAMVLRTLAASVAIAATSLASLSGAARTFALALAVVSLAIAVAGHLDAASWTFAADLPVVLLGMVVTVLWIVRVAPAGALGAGLILVACGTAAPTTLLAVLLVAIVPPLAARLRALGSAKTGTPAAPAAPVNAV